MVWQWIKTSFQLYMNISGSCFNQFQANLLLDLTLVSCFVFLETLYSVK